MRLSFSINKVVLDALLGLHNFLVFVSVSLSHFLPFICPVLLFNSILNILFIHNHFLLFLGFARKLFFLWQFLLDLFLICVNWLIWWIFLLILKSYNSLFWSVSFFLHLFNYFLLRVWRGIWLLVQIVFMLQIYYIIELTIVSNAA